MAPNHKIETVIDEQDIGWSSIESDEKAGELQRDCTEGFAAVEMERLRHAFRKFDKNGDGLISKEEFSSTLKCLGGECAKESVEQLLAEIDANSDGFVDFEEFLVLNRCAVQCCKKEKDDLAAAFGVFDLDKDGYISPKELQIVMQSVGEKGSSLADCLAMINRYDQNGDGKVDLAEFEAMMKQELRV